MKTRLISCLLLFALASSFSLSQAATEVTLGGNLQQPLSLDPDYSLQSVRRMHLLNGIEKERFIVNYKNVPIWNSVITKTQLSANQYGKPFGHYLQDIDEDLVDVTPTLTAAEAIEKVRDKFFLEEVSALENEQATLYILNDGNNKAHLVYWVSLLRKDKKMTRPHAFVDAHSGDILRQWEGLNTAQVAASGPGGNIKTGQYDYGIDFDFMRVEEDKNNPGLCFLLNPNVATFNLNHGTSADAPHSFSCPRNEVKPINEAFSPLNDAHSFASATVDFYLQRYGVPPHNTPMLIGVHLLDDIENAFWDGANVLIGDGKDFFYPLASLDVMAHEISHAFTELNSNLIYENQSGGMNESFSDMAGEALKFFVRGENDFFVGYDIGKKLPILRSMADPTMDGSSIDHASNFVQGMDVHFSSGVFNKAFYLIATAPGWDPVKAFDLFVFANALFWTPDSTFSAAANGVLQVALDLGYPLHDVCQAFSTVGVNVCQAPDPEPKIIELSQFQSIEVDGDRYGKYFYHLKVPPVATKVRSFTSIKVENGNIGLYLRAGALPTKTEFDCRSDGTSHRERCDLARTLDDPLDYYFMVYGNTDFKNVRLKVEYKAENEHFNKIISAPGGSLTHYSYYAKSGNKIVKLSGGTGDADLYVKRGSPPSLSSFDCRPFLPGNEEICEISGEGMFYIMVNAFETYKGVRLSVEKEEQEESVTSNKEAIS